MRPTGIFDATAMQWWNEFVQAASALPFGSTTPRAVRCRMCGSVLDGVAAGVGGIATQRFQAIAQNKNGLVAFGSVPVSESVLHSKRAFDWECGDCKSKLKLRPRPR